MGHELKETGKPHYLFRRLPGLNGTTARSQYSFDPAVAAEDSGTVRQTLRVAEARRLG
ncbi:hypothetical protein SPHINGOAX6_70704 [Sphingomonas sp. AX6]|nr:hypothetical protein SPHINGOAX6_70704 [Sphingomonas sp. AX6]